MRALIVISALAALPGPALAQTSVFRSYPASVRPLMAAEMRLDEKCRGEGDKPSTMVACNRRDSINVKLNRLGWCWGPDDAVEADKQWVRCGPHAHP